MREVEKTLVLSFSGAQAGGGSTAAVRAAWDDARNRAADGSVRSQFVPGESVYFIAQADAGARITRVAATSGAVVGLGAASRPQSDTLLFTGGEQSPPQLSWVPSSGLIATWYGNQGSGLQVAGRSVTVAAGYPCRATLAYSAAVTSYRLDTPRVQLAKEASWPIDVVIYYVEVS